MKTILAIIILISASIVNANDFEQVGKTITGAVFKNELRMHVSGGGGAEWIHLSGKNYNGLTARVRFENHKNLTEETMRTLRNAPIKSIEWADIATHNQVEVTKPLGCLSHNLKGALNKICAEHGIASSENHVGFRFSSSENGKDSYLIINLADSNNQYITSSIYLEPKQMKQFLDNVNLIESVFENKVRKSVKERMLFN